MCSFIIALLSSLALAVCTALRPIFLQDMVNAGTSMNFSAVGVTFALNAASIVGILLFETARQFSVGKYGVNQTKLLKRRLINRLLKCPSMIFSRSGDRITSPY